MDPGRVRDDVRSIIGSDATGKAIDFRRPTFDVRPYNATRPSIKLALMYISSTASVESTIGLSVTET